MQRRAPKRFQQAAALDFSDKHLNVPLYVIDGPQTSNHDDAVGWIDTGDGFLVYTAVTGVGASTKFITRDLPDTFTLSTKQTRSQANMGGINEAVVLTYWTDGEVVDQPSFRFTTVNSRRYTTKDVPEQIRKDLFHVTNQPSTESGIEQLMHAYNSILANTCAKQGISVPYYNKEHGFKEYSAEPKMHAELQGLYTRATSPLVNRVDWVGNLQIAKLLSGRGTPRNHRTMRKFCEHYTNEVQTGTLRNILYNAA